MRRQTFDDVQALEGLSQLPIQLKQTNHKFSQLPGLLLMASLAAFTVLPQFAIAGVTLTSSETRTVLANNPMIGLELALAAGFWAFLVLWPLRNIVLALFCERHVEIRDGVIHVVDRSPVSATEWSLPLHAYVGIAHHVRSSLSGVRHELVLVHGDRRRNVLLAAAPTIGQPEIRELCRLLELPEIPAAALYGWGGPPSARKATDHLGSVTA